jgi:uncharacterized membrane protein
VSADLTAALWGGAAALSWGVGDFSGGLAARRVSSLAVTLITNPVGLLLLIALALISNAPIPSSHDALLGVLVGASGAAGIFLFYEAMKHGKMGIAAPVSAVIANVISVAVSAVTEGAPGIVKWLGFALACAGVVLISRPEKIDGVRAVPRALLPAALSGIAFGVFFSLSAQFSSNVDVGWSLVIVRLTSLVIFFAAAALRKEFQLERSVLGLAVIGGICDSLGNLFFALAGQAGRLDITAVSSGMYPVATVILAVLILRERFTASQGVGALLALGAIVLIVAV